MAVGLCGLKADGASRLDYKMRGLRQRISRRRTWIVGCGWPTCRPPGTWRLWCFTQDAAYAQKRATS